MSDKISAPPCAFRCESRGWKPFRFPSGCRESGNFFGEEYICGGSARATRRGANSARAFCLPLAFGVELVSHKLLHPHTHIHVGFNHDLRERRLPARYRARRRSGYRSSPRCRRPAAGREDQGGLPLRRCRGCVFVRVVVSFNLIQCTRNT
jgi:hypothetical protein